MSIFYDKRLKRIYDYIENDISQKDPNDIRADMYFMKTIIQTMDSELFKVRQQIFSLKRDNQNKAKLLSKHNIGSLEKRSNL